MESRAAKKSVKKMGSPESLLEIFSGSYLFIQNKHSFDIMKTRIE